MVLKRLTALWILDDLGKRSFKSFTKNGGYQGGLVRGGLVDGEGERCHVFQVMPTKGLTRHDLVDVLIELTVGFVVTVVVRVKIFFWWEWVVLLVEFFNGSLPIEGVVVGDGTCVITVDKLKLLRVRSRNSDWLVEVAQVRKFDGVFSQIFE